MKKTCKVVALIVYLFGILAAGIFCTILFTPRQDFGSDKYVALLCMIVLFSAIIGTFFMTRKEKGAKKIQIVRTVTVLGGIAYFICLVGILFMSRVNRTRIVNGQREYSLVPFKTIGTYIKAYRNGTLYRTTIRRNLIGNFILFMPMAWVLPVVFRRLRNGIAFSIVMLTGLCMVEYVQFRTGRGSMDIDDVILNFAGAILVFLFLWNKTTRRFFEKNNVVSGRPKRNSG